MSVRLPVKASKSLLVQSPVASGSFTAMRSPVPVNSISRKLWRSVPLALAKSISSRDWSTAELSRLEVELDRLILVGRKTGLARRHAQRGRVGAAEVAARGIARDVERMVSTTEVDNGLIARRAKDLPAVLAIGDRAERHVIEGLRVAGRIGQRQVLDIGAERVVDRRLHRIDALVEQFSSHHVAAVVDEIGIVVRRRRASLGAGPADERVVAGAAVERIVAGSALEYVDPGRAGQGIGAEGAENMENADGIATGSDGDIVGGIGVEALRMRRASTFFRLKSSATSLNVLS